MNNKLSKIAAAESKAWKKYSDTGDCKYLGEVLKRLDEREDILSKKHGRMSKRLEKNTRDEEGFRARRVEDAKRKRVG